MNAHVEAIAARHIECAMRQHATWQHAARLHDAAGLLMMQGTLGLPLPFQNCVVRTNPAVSPWLLVDMADAFFGDLDQPYAVITRSQLDQDLEWHLRESGFSLQGDSPSMLTQTRVTPPLLHPRWKLVPLTSPDQLDDFVQVCAQAYESLGLPASFTPSYFTQREGLLDDNVSIVMAQTEAGPPMSAAMVAHQSDVAGVYWVGTLVQARGEKLAQACSAAVTNLAFERGCQAVTLQATPMGEGVYQKLGYREFARQQRWSREKPRR